MTESILSTSASSSSALSSSLSSSPMNTNRSRVDRLWDKIYAVIWIVLAIMVAKWTHFVPTVLLLQEQTQQQLPQKNIPVRSLLMSAMTCLGINTILWLYLTIYLRYCKGIKDCAAWDIVCPRVIPTMTFVTVVMILLFIRSTWPVWGFLSPLIWGVEAFGCLSVLHFIPWWT